jgi:benzoyl-CoA reductase/2-hydroxyglutaryl-CoA dehydratase subunit BcrC/BadD/HgdB
MNTLEEMAQIARTRPERLKEQKKNGARLVGYIGRFVPEELIHASGAVPYFICRGGEPEPPDAVIPYLLRFMSPYYRSHIGYHLLGMDPVMPMLDLIVMQSTDCQESRVADVFEYLKLPTARLGVPPDWEKSLSMDYYRNRVFWLKDKLEALTGNEISNDKLKASIESVNKIRELLKKISELRKQQPPAIGGYDFIRLNHYSYLCDPQIAAEKLVKIYEQLQSGASPFSKDSPRILLAGHVISIGDYVAPKLIEDSGGVIVAEQLDEGMRQYQHSVKTDGDLLKQLVATYYLNRTPPSVFQPSWEKRTEKLKQLVKEYSIDAVIWYQLSYEEIYDMECPIASKAMEEMKVPFLKLESSYEYSREAMGPLTTRIESFIQSAKQKRGR